MPQNLVEKILRMKIYNTTYWKEHCFGLTAASVVEKVSLASCWVFALLDLFSWSKYAGLMP